MTINAVAAVVSANAMVDAANPTSTIPTPRTA
jgi:hypothetical protein